MSFWDEGPENDEDKGIVNKQTLFASQKQPKYKYDESESSDEENKRKVKSPKEKLLESMKKSCYKIRDNLSSRNFIVANEVFDDLIKSFDRIKQLFSDNPPSFFIKTLSLLEETANITKEERGKISTKNNTALTGIKKTFSKYGKQFEENLKVYKENIAAGGEVEDEEESEQLSDEDNQVLSDVSVEVDLKKNDDLDPAMRRLKWVKKTPAAITGKTDEPIKQKAERVKQIPTIREKEREETFVVEKLDDKIIEKECNDITNQRGQISKNPTQTVERLDFLLTQTNNRLLIIKLLNLYILICFDTSVGQYSAITYEMWHKIHDSVLVLIGHYNNLMSDNNHNQKDALDVIKFHMKTTLVSFLEKLEMELYKSLQYTDQNSHEHILRIKDEITFIILCSKVLEFYKNFNEKIYFSRIYLLILLHIYYKTEDQIKKMGEKLKNENVKEEYLLLLADYPEKFLNKLSSLLYTHPEEKSKLKSLLAIIYCLCILNKYYKANVLFKKCNSYDKIGVLKDENLKILYNRTMAQLGLCAFRNGNYLDALFYLTPLCQMGTSKLKEYLCQSYNKEMEKSLFFDKEDKKRIIPFIMTITIEEVECTFYLTSMIIDLPNILLYKLGKTSGNVNFVFKKLMDNFEKQIFNGPPETIKEVILCSASSLTQGDWKKCSELILSLKCYNHYNNYKEIKNIIQTKIKSTGLKCYLIFYSGDIKNISMKNLSRKFEIEDKEIRKIINTMILDKHLEGKWRDDVLEIDSEDKNFKLIKKLEENLSNISNYNINLLEASSVCHKH